MKITNPKPLDVHFVCEECGTTLMLYGGCTNEKCKNHGKIRPKE